MRASTTAFAPLDAFLHLKLMHCLAYVAMPDRAELRFGYWLPQAAHYPQNPTVKSATGRLGIYGVCCG